MTEFKFHHIPVMLYECIEGLDIKKDGVYVDGTLGGCGHSKHIVKNGGKVIGIDRDMTAITMRQTYCPRQLRFMIITVI